MLVDRGEETRFSAEDGDKTTAAPKFRAQKRKHFGINFEANWEVNTYICM